jgi:hypothetical protein
MFVVDDVGRRKRRLEMICVPSMLGVPPRKTLKYCPYA